MQNALIKKKLEEQRYNFRKRQEIQQQTQQFNDANHLKLSPVKQNTINSQTQLAFTPTSVLRKMTAEKDDELNNQNKIRLPTKQQLSSPQKPNQLHIPGNIFGMNNAQNFMLGQNLLQHNNPNGFNQFINQQMNFESTTGHHAKPIGKFTLNVTMKLLHIRKEF